MNNTQYQPKPDKEGHHSQLEDMCHAGSTGKASWWLLLKLVVVFCCHPPTSTTPLKKADKSLSCDTKAYWGVLGRRLTALSPVSGQEEGPELGMSLSTLFQQDKSILSPRIRAGMSSIPCTTNKNI